jgi:parallel beta-helix repeat protein
MASGRRDGRRSPGAPAAGLGGGWLRSGESRLPDRETAASKLVILALVVAGFLAFGADQARASHVTCGDTISIDTKLDSDLTNCPGNGIVIGADDIELDLNGHTIDGDGVLGCDEFYACDFGVDNTAGHDGVTIENGTIRDFATAVFVLDAGDNRLRRVSASHNILGGVLLIASPHARVEHSSISANGLTTDQAGLIVFDSSEVLIDGNSIRDNGDIGMFLIGLGDSRLERNSVSGNPEAGMILDGSGNEVSRNRWSRNADGIVITGDGNTVVGNHVSDATGCPDGCGFGISLEGGTGNLIARNIVARAREAGIRVADFESEGGPPAIGNVVQRNLVLDAEIDGVLVESTATDTLLERNIAIGAGDDGIDVDTAATTLTRNLSLRNGDLGIEAVPGVIDGGGNKAQGNGNPAQCLNVACQ